MQSLNLYFTGTDQVEVRSEPVAKPNSTEVVVQTSKTLISAGTELICLGRVFEPGSPQDAWVKYPFSPGYSLTGRVVAVGKDVQSISEGDRVAVRAPHRQYVVVSENRLYSIPDGVSDEEATWFGIANIVQNGVRRAEHALGEAVVVIGLGQLGQLVVQYVRLLGAREVIAIDVAEQRLNMARTHGATATLAMDVERAREAVLFLTEGAGADVVYEVTGAASVFTVALGLVRRFGRLLLLGDTGSPSAQRLSGDVIQKGLSIIGAHDNHPPVVSSDHAYWSHQKMACLFFTYLHRGEMRVSDLITHCFSPTDAPEAYRLLREERARAMGVIFDWSHL